MLQQNSYDIIFLVLKIRHQVQCSKHKFEAYQMFRNILVQMIHKRTLLFMLVKYAALAGLG